jgi:hypothetical protein
MSGGQACMLSAWNADVRERTLPDSVNYINSVPSSHQIPEFKQAILRFTLNV